MNVWVGTVRLRTGVGTQSVTGIVNADGLPFTPTHIFAVNGSSEVDVLHAEPSGTFTAASANTNATEVAGGLSGYSASADVWFPSSGGFKIGDSGGGNGPDAAIDSLQANILTGGLVYRTAAITAAYAGGFDLSVTLETFAVPTDVLLIVFETDATFDMAWLGGSASATLPTAFPAKGWLNPKTQALAATGIVSTATGGGFGWGWGWDSPHGGPGSAHVFLGNQTTTTARYQSAVSGDNTISGSPPVAADGAHVTAWNASTLVFSGIPSAAHRGFIVGGPNILTASGRLLQAATAGPQVVPTPGLHPRVVFFASVGSIPSTTIQTPGAECCFGCATADGRQASYWVGETADASPLTGACFLSASSVLRFPTGGAAGASTVFTSIATLTEMNPAGTFTLHWASSDGVGREVLWFAIGTPPPPPIPPAPPGRIEPIRRLRQAPHLWDGTSGHRLKYPGFQLLVEAGAPRDTDGPMSWVLQWSDDGGHSWSHEHRIEGSRLGEHTFRFWWRRLGQSRDRVFRVVNSDDCKIVVIDALLTPDPVEGSS